MHKHLVTLLDAAVTRATATNVAVNVVLALIVGLLAWHYEPGVTRDWLWFCAGIQIGFAIFWLMQDRIAARSRRLMREEMNMIGAHYVEELRRLDRELYSNPHMPQPPHLPRVH